MVEHRRYENNCDLYSRTFLGWYGWTQKIWEQLWLAQLYLMEILVVLKMLLCVGMVKDV